ncbi:orotidine-5'-phosphate decarboxylase [Euryarchaeota archaeon]|nr:orotidine-5'-phosphate decarboxylase [Euryarchaeota archaeon]
MKDILGEDLTNPYWLISTMKAEAVWGMRWKNCANPLAHRIMEIAFKKKSLVCLAADMTSVSDLINLIKEVGPYISVLKTHVDLVQDFTQDEWGILTELAEKYELLLFEDRKFADIGKISQQQMSGVHDIRSWADIVTAHRISGPDIVDGIAAGWADVERIGGVLLLAQMSSRGNLLDTEYTRETIVTGKGSPHVLGYIGNGSSAEDVADLRVLVGEAQMIWTPGINLDSAAGKMGQRYGNPRDSIMSGSDIIIVGSGIHGAKNRATAAKLYAEASWSALLERGR